MTASTITLKDAAAAARFVDQPTAAARPAVVALAPERRALVEQRADRACRRIAPLWPLKHFVAVNPFLGLSGQRFDDAARTLARVTGARMTLPRAFYREQIESGRIEDRDLRQAVARAGATIDIDALKRAARDVAVAPPVAVPTVADMLQQASGEPWPARVTGEIAKWCAAWFDEGQAGWPMPWRDRPLFAAWKAAALIDRTAPALGLQHFAEFVGALPNDPVEAIDTALAELAIPDELADDYLHRAIAGIGGWAARARHRVWQKELHGGSDTVMVHLLAVRLAWEAALYRSHATQLAPAWRDALAIAAERRRESQPRELEVDLLLQQAFEMAVQRELLGRLDAPAPAAVGEAAGAQAAARKAVQAVFCIDVRSEVFRRQLERVSARVQTMGFAGFFGFPIEYVPLGEQHGGAQCPVLLTPATRVREVLRGAEAAQERRIAEVRSLRRRLAAAWKSFKLSTVSCFAFVEAAGPWYAMKLLGDSLGLSRPVPHPMTFGLAEAQARQAAPRIDAEENDGIGGSGGDVRLKSGFAASARVDMAAAVLGAMSLTRDFARLVVLAGHGSTTVNNPHASGLDCGACGGHTGQANARVAAAILNDAGVRQGLAARGIAIPEDTWFVAALHDTTTDEVRLFDEDAAPASHRAELVQLQQWLREAGRQSRVARSPLLGLDGQPERVVHQDIARRSRDWSQVRPEWGLAGNIAFIAAPRSRTQGLDLAGRCFLHDYDWRGDAIFGVLELIMTAPMVVASWINLQYYGSTVDNAAFGSGNKVLHNVVGGTVGVLEGNGGDLRTGLPWQSVHDGKRYVHEPVRLSVFIEAPQAAIDRVIEKHAAVRELVDHGWLHLFRIGDDGRAASRYAGGLRWKPASD